MKILTICIIVCSVLTCKNTENAMASKKQNSNSITGDYNITSINNQTTNHEGLTISFNEKDNSVYGYSGCNRFTGSFEKNGNDIKIGPLASTRMACEPAKNDIENKILEALSEVNSFEVENDILNLKKDKNPLIIAKKISSNLSQYTITYNAVTRGTYINYVIEDGMISIQNNHNQKPIKNDISSQDRLELQKDLEGLSLDSLNSLEPPSKAHQYDGAAGATLTITNNGKTYKTPTFDHGNPPKSIENIVNKVLSMKKKEEKH